MVQVQARKKRRAARAHTIPLPDLLTVIELDGKDVVRLNRRYVVRRAAPPPRKGPSPALWLGREFRRNWKRATVVLLLWLVGDALLIAFLVWLIMAPTPPPGGSPSLGRRLGDAVMGLAMAIFLVTIGRRRILEARARAVLLAAAARSRRYRPAAFARRIAGIPDPSAPSVSVWKREIAPGLSVVSHLLASLPYASVFLAVVLFGPAVVINLSKAAAGSPAVAVGPVMLGVLLCLLALVGALMFGPALLRWRVESRVARGCCGNCGYDLTGLDPAKGTPQPFGGPARCPECACRRPLLLPPGRAVLR